MNQVLSDRKQLDFRIFDIPLSAIIIEGKKIRYFDFISSLSNNDCNKALKRIHPWIKMDQIQNIIVNTPFLTDLQKTFYMTILSERKSRILDFSLQKLK